MPERVAQKRRDPPASLSGSNRVRFSLNLFGAPGKLEKTLKSARNGILHEFQGHEEASIEAGGVAAAAIPDASCR
jgi:hypothetical protein